MEESRKIFKFNGLPGEDFHLWMARTEAALEDRNAWSVVQTDVVGGATEPAPLTEEQSKAVSKARALIMQGLGDNPLRLCLHQRANPYKMWQVLSERYAKVNVASKVQLQYQLSRLVYRNQSMSEYLDQFQTVYNRLAAMGSVVEEDMQIATLLASFGDKERSPFGHVVAALQASDSEISWQSATASLLQAYAEKSLTGRAPAGRFEEKSLALSVRNRHVPFKPGSRFGSRGSNQERRRCYHCNRVGHLKRNCPELRHDHGGTASGSAGSVNHATVLMAVTDEVSSHRLLLDSGASDTMVNNAQWLQDVTSIEPRTITLGNGQTIDAVKKGTLCFDAVVSAGGGDPIVRHVTVPETLLVPKLKENLVSCSALSNQGYHIHIAQKGATGMLNGLLMFQAFEVAGVYSIKLSQSGASVSQDLTDSEKLWHQRMGHGNIRDIRDLARRGAVSRMDLSRTAGLNENCTSCIQGKHHK